MGLKANISLDRISSSGQLLEHHVQPGRSFLVNMIYFLYAHHAGVGYTANQLQQLQYSDGWSVGNSMEDFCVVSKGGIGEETSISGSPPSELIGIVIGTGSAAVVTGDFGLYEKIPSQEGRQLYSSWPIAQGGSISGIRLSGIVSDGTYWYISSVGSGLIYVCTPRSCEVITTLPTPGENSNYCNGIAYDGTFLYTPGYVAAGTHHKIYKLNKATGAVISSWFTPAAMGNRQCVGIGCYDGANLWLSDVGGTYQLHKVTTAGAYVSSVLPAWGNAMYGSMSWDGTHMWCATNSGIGYSGRWYAKFDLTTGALIQQVPIAYQESYSGGYDGTGNGGCMWYNGYLWITQWKYTGSSYYYNWISQWSISSGMYHSGCEVLNDLATANPNASFTIRRYFTNNTGAPVTVNEVGIYCGYRILCIARDVVVPGVTVLNGEVLKVEYTVQITV